MIRLREFGFGFVVFMASVLIAFGLTESVLRIKNMDQRNYNIEMWRYAKVLKVRSPNKILGHEHKPGSTARIEGVEIRLDQYGMRGPQPDLTDHDQKRILFLGSSNTMGWGVPEEKTMTAILQRELKGRAQVWNAGIGNYNARRYVTLFETKLRKLKPDVVVVHYYINDAESLDAGGGNIILRHSQAAVLMYHATYSLFNKSGVNNISDYYKAVYDENSPGLKDMQIALLRLKEMSEEDGFKVLFVMTPEVHQIKPYPFDQIHKRVKRLANQLGWPYLDVTDAIYEDPSNNLWIMPDDPHINSLGHEIMAGEILPFILQNLPSS
jgi:lysophospholipase L1-like esterase